MRHFLLILSAIIIILSPSRGWVDPDPWLNDWTLFSKSTGKGVLTAWLYETADVTIAGGAQNNPLPEQIPEFYGNSGLFITLMKDKKVRGCFGAFHHKSGNIEALLKYYIKGALFLDPRYRPLDPEELDKTEIILTIAGTPERVENINSVNLSGYGLFIECPSGQGTVIVPEEFRTSSYIKKKFAEPGCEVSRFRAVTIK